ncbi:MAG TPA: HAMP domain-containing sensor histidine kinase [Acidimicrobiales bacterium]|nr:HAMP domain-containing sensor histidine kinase [Acidimicrobiales bacterium]
MSLRLRLTLAASLLLAVLLLLGVLLVNSVGSSELRQIDQQLKNSLPVARTLDSTTTPTFPPRAKSPKTFAADRFSAFYIASITKGHRSVVSTPLDANGASPQLPPIATTPHHTIKISTVGSVSGSLQWRAVLLKLPKSNTEVLVAVSLSQVNTTMSFLRLAILFAGLIVLAVVVATGFWIARLGLRPIAEVTEVADAIAAGDRTRRVTRAQRRTEAGKLATAFNLMLDEQLALEARLRQFIADASHELRTPVSVILGITELWRQGELRNGEERDEAIHRIGLSGNQMGKLVEELLLLARLDEGRPMDRAPVDLERLIHEVVADALTTNPQRTVTVDVTETVIVQGDAFRLRQVVSNLVNNALRYTPGESVVEVRLSVDADSAILDVDDSGPGMSEEDASHAFDRFWQADASRSRSGAGLGLPIVQGIVIAHDGSVTLDSRPSTGTRVRVTIPLGGAETDDHDVSAVGPL